jgi:tetratricopeptide (TPR) repeat protein
MVATLGVAVSAFACVWDRDSLAKEKIKSPQMAAIILGSPQAPSDARALHARIEELQAHRDEKSAAWWNDLAGAYLRLGRPSDAVKLLEPVVRRFPNDYGIHANLGTAYHLLGNYQKAEKEIARDLEINPDGHFGLERYHLALLQYLVRDEAYRKTHVYIDEFTPAFFHAWDPQGLFEEWPANDATAAPDRPAYRLKWDLASDPKLREGAIYMASLNPKEPACFVALGIVCLQVPSYSYDRDLNLAAAAFEKAIDLGSPQRDVLSDRIKLIRNHVGTSDETSVPPSQKASAPHNFSIWIVTGLIGGVALVALSLARRMRRAPPDGRGPPSI